MDFHPAGPSGAHSRWPDGAFIPPDHRHIIVNEGDNQVIDLIDIATKRIIGSYGHTGVVGTAPGYFDTPDDAIQTARRDPRAVEAGAWPLAHRSFGRRRASGIASAASIFTEEESNDRV